MINSFDTEVAQDVGVIPAVLYKNIQFWCEKNRTNGTHFHDGFYWSYNSIKAFCDQFPYLSKDQITYALKKLEDSGYIKIGNYNANQYDRTKWYADVKSMYCISENSEIDLTKNQNGFDEIPKPIPYINTDNKPNILVNSKGTKPDFESILDSVEVIRNNPDLRQAFHDFMEMRKKTKHPITTERALKLAINDAYKHGSGDPAQMVACINQSILNNWRGIFPVHEEKGMAIHRQAETARNGPKNALDVLDEMLAEEMAKEANNA